jgi:hypothetical protein
MPSAKDVFATSYKLSDFIHSHKGFDNPLKEAQLKKSETRASSEDEKNINMLLCWAY